jgi:PKD repeat protein
MVARLVRAAVSAAVLLALAAPAAAHAASPPRFVATQWLLRVPLGTPAWFMAKAVDPDHDAVTIGWAFDDGTVATGKRVTKSWATPGTHTATVTATDATGLKASRTLAVAVTADAAAPIDDVAPVGVLLPRPGPPPGATTVATPRLTVAAGALRLGRNATIAVPVTCAAGADCAGRLVLARDSRRLASAPYGIRAGHSATVRLRLSAATAARLRRRASSTVTVVVAADGRPAVRTSRTLLAR